MIQAFSLAIAQLGDRNFRRPLVLGLSGAALVFVALWIGLWLLLTRTHLFAIGWLDTVVAALGELAAIGLAFILYPAVAASLIALFLDQVVDAVEARHYPGMPPPRRIGLGEQLKSAARLLLLAIVLNLLVLPVYFLPPINLLVFYALNGYILGREYFELVAARRLDPPDVSRAWRDHRWGALAMGAVIAFLSTLPLINLVAPLVGVAAMTHQLMSWGVARGSSK
ncbi:MAG TPA: EI24 domain-containing protein [Alphaproteobacteria bacterium]